MAFHHFIMKTNRLISTLPVILMSAALAAAPASELPPAFAKGARILFQGDSITDMNRGRNADPNHILGHSYAFLIAAEIGAHFPEQKLEFFNRGVSGNSVSDLAARWKYDTLAIKPDILSVLVGINDIGKAIRANKRVDADLFEKTYDQILADARAANPKLKIILCDPFVVPGKSTSARLNDWQEDVNKLQAAVERLAARYQAPVVHLQKVFDDAQKRAEVSYWIWDGVHPTYAGQQLLAEAWLNSVRQAWPNP
jgi:lysophospholipase L1-like esterase